MKRLSLFLSLLIASSFFIAGCGGSSSVDTTVDNPQIIAIDKIKAYAEDQTQPVPTVEDYDDAGVVGVTVDNLDDINDLVAGLTAEDVDTPEEIQAIVDEYGIILPVADATRSTVEATTPVVADGSSTTMITVTLKDSSGNFLFTGGDTVTMSGTGSTVISTVTDNNDGTYTFTATNTVAEDVTYTGTVNSVTITDTAVVTFTAPIVIGDADATNANTTVNATTPVVADGSSTTTITVTLADSNGNLLITGGDTVTMSGTGSTVISTVTDNNDGTYTFTATNTVAEDVTYTGTVNSVTITDTAVVTFTAPGTTDDIVGQTVEFSDISGASFSFYQNGKFVKTTCINTCTDGTGEFAFIGSWSGSTNGTDATNLTLLDDTGSLIPVTAITSSKPIYHVTLLEGKDSQNNYKVQGWAIREKNADGIKFVYFRDPADGVTPPTLFSTFGYDLTAQPVPQSFGAAGMWVIVDGKVVASNPGGEIGTYAFDREPGTGAIVTKTIAGDLVDVIVTHEFYQLKPSVIDEADRIVEFGETLTGGDEALSGKLMTINDKVYGPSAWYFEPRGAIEADKAYIIAAGISIDGKPWGGKGDDGWRINADGISVDIKIHYEGATVSTKERLRFGDAVPTTGTLVSKYTSDDNGQTYDFNGTTAAARFVDY